MKNKAALLMVTIFAFVLTIIYGYKYFNVNDTFSLALGILWLLVFIIDLINVIKYSKKGK